jgi:hypothetical protein
LKNNTLDIRITMNGNKVDVLLGPQWGDEGKGKVVDVLTPWVRYNCPLSGRPQCPATPLSLMELNKYSTPFLLEFSEKTK